MKDTQLHTCPNCELQVRTRCEEYVCPKCNTHIIEPPGKPCQLCVDKLRTKRG